MTNDERMQRESSLIATVRKELPEFAKACADDTELVLLHQDAFAADYQEDEYKLLGMTTRRVWPCFKSRTDAVAATAPIFFSATTLAAS